MLVTTHEHEGFALKNILTIGICVDIPKKRKRSIYGTSVMFNQTDRLADRIRELRLQQGWSLQELADRSSVSKASLSRIENADVSPNTEVLGKLCSAYGITLTRLIAPLENCFQALVKREEQTTWVDEEKGFERRVMSPPSGSLRSEVIKCQLKPNTVIDYETPPVPGQEHHLVMIDGTLDVIISGERHQLSNGDCLRYQLFGASSFKTRRSAATYILFLG